MTKKKGTTPLPDDHHVCRYVPNQRQHRDFDTGQLIGVLTTAFDLRPQDKGGLSVTWVEFFGPKTTATLKQAADAYRKCTRSKKLTPSAAFAVGNVLAIKKASAVAGKPARVLHEQTKCNAAHAAIRRLDNDQIEVLDAIAQQAFGEIADRDGSIVCLSPAMGISPS